MTNTPTRREILKAAATSGVTGIALSTTASATATTVRTVEAGIRYDFDIKETFNQIYLNSRPPYTINTDRKELVYPNRAPASMTAQPSEAGALFAERPVRSGKGVEVGPENRHVSVLPTKLSTRMRPMEGVRLTSKQRLPKVSIQRNGRTPWLAVPSEERTKLSSGTGREIHLSPQTVEVQTVRVTDDVVPVEGRPQHRWGPKRKYGSAEVKVTPVISIADHGELTLKRQKLP